MAFTCKLDARSTTFLNPTILVEGELQAEELKPQLRDFGHVLYISDHGIRYMGK